MNLVPLKRIRTRRLVAAAGSGLLYGVVVCASILLVTVAADAAVRLPRGWLVVGLAAAAICLAVGIAITVRRLVVFDGSLLASARAVAARVPGSANALVTMLEPTATGKLPTYVRGRVEHAASAELVALQPSSVYSLKRHARLLVVAAFLTLGVILPFVLGYAGLARLVQPVRAEGVVGATNGASSPLDAGDRIAVTVVPPAYTGAPAVHLVDPSEIGALAGSRVELSLTPGLAGVSAVVSVNGADADPMSAGSAGILSLAFPAMAEGSVAVRPAIAGVERDAFVLPLRVVADAAPEVRIVSPKGDVLIEPSVRPKHLVVQFEASDDFGLGDMKLRYIRSVGEGDAAQFVNGELPVAVAERRPNGVVVGSCDVDLDKLGIVAGATLVYHVEAHDRNTVTGPSTGLSESLVFEVASPKPPASITLGELKPEDLQRFLMSERIILDHTTKLEAERSKLPHDEFLARATEVAGEQRDFKESFSQFIEIKGENDHDHDAEGAIRNEKAFEEAQRHAAEEAHKDPNDVTAKGEEAHEQASSARIEAHNHGAAEGEGPVTSPAHELQLAVSAMWDAEGALGIGETAAAIPHEQRAIDRLKRAQRAVRYFPRVRVKTPPIDLKRRYSADLAEIKNRLDRLEQREPVEGERATRDALASLYDLMRTATAFDAEHGGPDTAARADELATRIADESATLLKASSGYQPALVAVAARLSAAAAESRRAATAMRSSDVDRVRSAISAVDDGLVWSAGQIAALLDARAVPRGASGVDSVGADRRGADYFRRLAGAGGSSR